MTMELLNNVDHRDLRVITRSGAMFGDAVSQILVFPTEFETLQRHYPIVLRKSDEGLLRPYALLGFDPEENLFLDDHGRWRSGAVPAMLARGPFGIAAPEGEDRDPMIRVDLSHPRVVTDASSAGEALFLPQGGKTAYLERLTEILHSIYIGHRLLDPMVEALQSAGLLRVLNLEARVGETEVRAIPNVVTIDRERLAALPATDLDALNRRGFLHSAFMIAASLGNLQTLADLKARRDAGAAA